MFELNYIQVQVNCKDGVHMCVLCVYVALMEDFYLIKIQKTNGVIAVFSGLESIGNSSEIRKNGWLCEALETQKLSLLPTFFGAWQIRHFFD